MGRVCEGESREIKKDLNFVLVLGKIHKVMRIFLIPVTILLLNGCINSEEELKSIDFKNPILSIAEDSTVAVTLKSNRSLSTMDTIYIISTGGEALYLQDFTTNILWKNDTLKIAGSDKDSVTFFVSALLDNDVEETEYAFFEIVKFSRGIKNGLKNELTLEISNKTDVVEFNVVEVTTKERSKTRISLLSSLNFANPNATFLIKRTANSTATTADYSIVSKNPEQFLITSENSYFDIIATYDNSHETSETVIFEISETTGGYEIGDNKSVTVTINNNNIGDNLVGEYLFIGNAKDTSPNNTNHGTVFGSAPTTDRSNNLNNAFIFDGINDYISIPDYSATDFNSTGDFSISLWVSSATTQSPNNPSFNDILRKWVGDSQAYPFAISYCSNDHTTNPSQFLVGSYDGSACGNAVHTFSNAMTSETFHHIVVVKRDTKLILYVNNSKISEVTSNITCPTSNNTHITVGSRGQLVRFFTGKIDDLRFYNTAISTNLIAELYGETPIQP